MNRLKKLLATLQSALGIQGALLDRARRRTKANHVRGVRAEKQARAARRAADELRKKASAALAFGPGLNQPKGERLLRKAARKDKKAGRLDVVATRNHNRAIFWKGRVKVLVQRVEKIDTRIESVQEEIRKSSAHVEGNKVVGGSEFDRWMTCQLTAVANCANGQRRNFYSMPGAWDIDNELVGGPRIGNRSDCSSTTGAGWPKACGLPDPSGTDFTGGFTGTMATAHGRWRQVSLEEMLELRLPAFIIYGSGNGHHTEGWCPLIGDDGRYIDAMRTAGHGSAPVDFGTVHLFGTGEVERYYVLDPH